MQVDAAGSARRDPRRSFVAIDSLTPTSSQQSNFNAPISHHTGARSTAFPTQTTLLTPCTILQTSNQPIKARTATFLDFACKKNKAISKIAEVKERMESSDRMVGRPVDPARARQVS